MPRQLLQILEQLDAHIASTVPSWGRLPLFSKVCFVAAAFGPVLYIGLVIRGRLFKRDETER
jgi:hypothetical protein